MIVFVKKEHEKHIKDVAAESVGTGIMGKMVRTKLTVSEKIHSLSFLQLHSNENNFVCKEHPFTFFCYFIT